MKKRRRRKKRGGETTAPPTPPTSTPSTHTDTSWVGLGFLPSCRTMAPLLLSVEQLQGSRARNTSEIPHHPKAVHHFHLKKMVPLLSDLNTSQTNVTSIWDHIWWTSCRKSSYSVIQYGWDDISPCQLFKCAGFPCLRGKKPWKCPLLNFSYTGFHKYLVPLIFLTACLQIVSKHKVKHDSCAYSSQFTLIPQVTVITVKIKQYTTKPRLYFFRWRKKKTTAWGLVYKTVNSCHAWNGCTHCTTMEERKTHIYPNTLLHSINSWLSLW